MTEGQTRAAQGIFITFEGGEGAGKTTHISFLAQTLRAHGYEVVCLREPGGTKIGEQLRDVVLNPHNETMTAETELLIYEAARAQVITQVIKPALERGAVVVCDRFLDSTIAYQVYGRGLPREFVDAANEFVCQGIYPHRTILMSAGTAAKTGLKRATKRGADRLERAGEDFHTRVNEAFFAIARAHPERIRVVFSVGRKSDTAAKVFSQLEDLFPWMAEITSHDAAFFKQLDTKPFKDKTFKGKHAEDEPVKDKTFKDERARDAHAKDERAKDEHAKDEHAKDEHARGKYAEDGHARGQSLKGNP